MPAAAKSSSMFRGDNEELLDHLLFACHEHKSKPTMEGFGRALTPYFAEDQGPVPCGRQHQSCGSPPQQRSMMASAKKHSRKASHASHGNGQRSLSSDEMERAPPAPRTHKSGGGGGAGSPLIKSYNPRVSAPGTPACPAFFSSPKPDAIPMPSFAFINKAGAIGVAPRMCAAA
jgi:hypothetical protein